jgi:general secretion pathway protein N
MTNLRSLAAAGVAAFLVFALITLPANVVVPRIQPEGVTLAGLDGSVWNGSAQVLQIGGVHVGSVSWKLQPLALFTLQIAADVDLKRTDGFARGGVRMGANRVRLEDFSASLPIGVLSPQLAPGGWAGSINARFAELTLVDQWPVSANGTVDLIDLTGPARQPANLGTFQLKFPIESNEANTLAGSIIDIDGPIRITGRIDLKAADRSYLIDALVATKPAAPASFSRTLQFLGPPDAQGWRQFSLSGTM